MDCSLEGKTSKLGKTSMHKEKFIQGTSTGCPERLVSLLGGLQKLPGWGRVNSRGHLFGNPAGTQEQQPCWKETTNIYFFFSTTGHLFHFCHFFYHIIYCHWLGLVWRRTMNEHSWEFYFQSPSNCHCFHLCSYSEKILAYV